ncbi:MAG TPA: hypothetical protein DCE44_07480 [Verrucomicrobiales bacterium]|nr:hypothetical protein [Verrucomicrobiales bacterium]
MVHSAAKSEHKTFNSWIWLSWLDYKCTLSHMIVFRVQIGRRSMVHEDDQTFGAAPNEPRPPVPQGSAA